MKSIRPPPCFCKTVSEYCLEGGPSCWMQVPPEFVRSYLPHVDRMRTVLQNAGGEAWPVQFVAEHGFVTGWAEFATGNALAIGDTLVFSFVEEGKKFVVKGFGKSGCEKGTRQQRKDPSPPPFRADHDPSGQQAESCKLQSRGVPSARTQAAPRNVAKAMGKRCDPAWRNSRAQKQARALVTKARLRKMNFTPPKQQQGKKQNRSVGDQSDGGIGLDAASEYHGERGGGRSSLGSRLWDDTEAAAGLRAFAEHGMNHRCFRRDDVDDPPPPKPGRPRKVPPQDSVVTEKRKRGRPLKHQAPGGTSDLTASMPLRDIFVSRRRKVTQAERELALNSAYQLASQLHASATTCTIVMRQSSVYRNFVLCVPRPFANRYMPDTNREVALVDSSWNAWFGAWNAHHKYISGGWRNFALEHCLEEDDALVLEIVEDHPQALTLKVHLFPVVPVPEGLTGWHSHVCPPNVSCDWSEKWNSTGVPIDPSVLRAVGTIQPRPQRPRKRRVDRMHVFSSSDSEDEFTTESASDSSAEFD